MEFLTGIRNRWMLLASSQSHHEKLSFQDEFRRLLIRHGIEFEERYLFEEEHIV